MLGQILGCEAGTVDSGSKGVSVDAGIQVELFQALNQGLVDLMVFGDGGKVNHGCGVVGSQFVESMN